MRHVVVGASAAGLAAAEAILSVDPKAEVSLLTEESHPPYCRPLISYWLARETPDSLFPVPSPALAAAELRLGARAVSLDPRGKSLRLASDEVVRYDRLCLATGAASKALELPGEEAANVFGFRTRDDAGALDAAIEQGGRRAVVLGGGLVGIKAAHALVARGVETVLAIASGHPLSQTVDPEAGALVRGALEKEGVRVRVGHRPVELVREGERITGVRFDPPGAVEPCDLVVRGKGVEPRSELVRELGFVVDGGIPADAHLRTPLPDVWVAGDAAAALDVAWSAPRVNAIWPVAVEQGAAAGRNMAGARETYPGSVAMNSVKIGTLFLVSVGIVQAAGPTFRVLARRAPGRDLYRRVVTRDGVVVGGLFAGHEGEADAVHQAGLLVAAVRRGSRLDELPFDPLADRLHWGAYAFATERSAWRLEG